MNLLGCVLVRTCSPLSVFVVACSEVMWSAQNGRTIVLTKDEKHTWHGREICIICKVPAILQMLSLACQVLCEEASTVHGRVCGETNIWMLQPKILDAWAASCNSQTSSPVCFLPFPYANPFSHFHPFVLDLAMKFDRVWDSISLGLLRTPSCA